MKGINKIEINKDMHLPDKKYDFYQDLFIKQEDKPNLEQEERNGHYERLLNKHKVLGGVFFAISFASLLSLCIVSNGSGNVQKEMENNYQEVFAATLNLQPDEDNLHLVKNLNQAFSNYRPTSYRITSTVNISDNNALYYKIPSNFSKDGTPVKIEYKSNLYINDTVKFVFSDLDGSPFRQVEKKVLLSKLTNKNFPGYNVQVFQENNSNLVATITRNPALNYSPSYNESGKNKNVKVPVPIVLPNLPVPPVMESTQKMPDNKVEVDISKMPVPVFIIPADKNGEINK